MSALLAEFAPHLVLGVVLLAVIGLAVWLARRVGASGEANRRIQNDVDEAIEREARGAAPLPDDDHMGRLGMRPPE